VVVRGLSAVSGKDGGLAGTTSTASPPTWSGDYVLRIPACEGGDDRALRAATMEKVVAIYCDAEGLRGGERDAFMAAELKGLEIAATPRSRP